MSQHPIHAEITEINNLTSLKEIIKQQDKNSLVIFDIDYVIIMPTDEYTLSRNEYRKHLWKEIKSKYDEKTVKLLHSIITAKAKWSFVDPEIADIISDLKLFQIPTIGLTSLSTGKLGIIEKREDLRIQELKSLGINFEELSTLNGHIFVKHLEENDGIPMLHKGIIFTAERDKALILEQILNNKNYYPKTIIFIDDMLKNLESVKNLCSKLQIKFHGLHYTAASTLPEIITDNHLEDLRFEILKKELIWLNNSELEARLERR